MANSIIVAIHLDTVAPKSDNKMVKKNAVGRKLNIKEFQRNSTA